MIVVIDFGSQTCHLIGRRLSNLGIKTKIIDPETSLEEIKKLKPKGIILSGGPNSVYKKCAPKMNRKILSLDIPVLGICYGWQLIAQLLGGKIVSDKKEYGPEKLILKTNIKNKNQAITNQVGQNSLVWLSHGDSVIKLPKGFKVLGSTKQVRNAFSANFKKQIYGLQFHPEVQPTQFGKQILKNFAQEICHLQLKKRRLNLQAIIKNIKNQVKEDKVVVAVSGGIDSTVTAVLLSRAIGNNLYPIYIKSGLMRLDTDKQIKKMFIDCLNIKPIIISAEKLFLKKLAGVTNPEKKRQIIGRLYVELFEQQAKKIAGVKYLAQGTIYSDVIESKGTQKASKIKSHHNVGGLPKKMKLKLIEPLREFYKDEVRLIAKRLGLPKDIVLKQPFPGPGQAIRIIGKITKTRLNKQQQADQIVLKELTEAGWLTKVFQSFPIMTGINSTAVKGDQRSYGEVVALRVYGSLDIMTASWSRLPYWLLQKISSRIVNEVPDVSRVVYDITTKPPATMEWE